MGPWVHLKTMSNMALYMKKVDPSVNCHYGGSTPPHTHHAISKELHGLEVDLLVRPRWLIPVQPEGAALEAHALAVHEGRILAVLPAAEAERLYRPAQTIDLADHAVLPGFINLHTHAAMSLMRGMADDLPLMRWLSEHIWPAEGASVSEEYVADGLRLACAEFIRGGQTCFNDMYFFPESMAEVIEEVGIRANLGMILLMFPTVYASGPPEYIEKGKALHASLEASGWAEGRLTLSWAPHAPYTVTDENWMEIKGLCEEMGVRLHTHLHETKGEVESVQQRSVNLDAGSDAGLLLLLAEQVLLCAGHNRGSFFSKDSKFGLSECSFKCFMLAGPGISPPS